MLVGPQGYVPEPHFLTETLRSQNRFHDPHQDSLFSNAGTVQGFREWSSGSGHSTPLNSENPLLAHRTLPVRSTRPIGHPEFLAPVQKAHAKQNVSDKISENVYEAQLPSLVTPRSAIPGGAKNKSIRYAILEVQFIYLSQKCPLIVLDVSGILYSIAVTSASTVVNILPQSIHPIDRPAVQIGSV